MDVRCHVCGAVIDATQAVRREVVLSRVGPLLQKGMGDLCRSCDAKEQRKPALPDEVEKLFAANASVAELMQRLQEFTLGAMLPTLIVLVALFLVYCLYNSLVHR